MTHLKNQVFIVSVYSDNLDMPSSEVVIATNKQEVLDYYVEHRPEVEVHSVLDKKFIEMLLSVIEAGEQAKPYETEIMEAVPLIRLQEGKPVSPMQANALSAEDGGF